MPAAFETTLTTTPIIAIMRANSSDALIDAGKALHAGGISLIEVTLTTPGAVRTIESARDTLSDEVIFGAGSVLDAESARAAIFAGAQFIVTPTVKVATIELCKRYGVPVVSGAYTPTEILTAWEAGADMVKVFPVNVMGPGYIKAVKAPMPQLKLAAVGGISTENLADYLKAGADALGVGSTLVNEGLLAEANFSEITRRAEAMVVATRAIRTN